MLGKKEIETQNKQSNLSVVMQKMKDTLAALGNAFDQAMDLTDPINKTHHEIRKVTDAKSKKYEAMNL
jgi:hypothetical protein